MVIIKMEGKNVLVTSFKGLFHDKTKMFSLFKTKFKYYSELHFKKRGFDKISYG